MTLAETIYSALMDLGKGQCDCDRPIDPSRYVSLSDVEAWLTKYHIKEVKQIAEKYMPSNDVLEETIKMLGSKELRG